MEGVIKRFVLLNPPGIIEVIIILLLFAVAVCGFLRSVKGLDSVTRKSILASLYLVSFSLITMIMLNPALRVESYREEKPTLAVVIDNSWSMNLPSGSQGVPRIQRVREYLTDNRESINQLEDKFFVKYYAFDDSLRASSLDYINKTEPNGRSTRILKSIEDLVDTRSPIKADSVILFSDGVDNKPLADSPVDFSENIDAKINTVFPADDGVLPDIWIDNIKSPGIAFLRYTFDVEVTVRSVGFGGVPIAVTLKEGERVISVKDLVIDRDSGQGVISFSVTPNSLGRKIYKVDIPTIEGDLIEQNNQSTFLFDVIINKIRVLHISGSPSWDVRFLRKALKRNPNVDLVSFFILREANDLVFASQDDLSLIPFPANEIFGRELDSFDVVIFQNFDFRPYGIFDVQLENLRNYVVQRGGGFLVIGGDNSFSNAGYERSGIADILPVRLGYSPVGYRGPTEEKGAQTILTQTGIRHPILRIVPDELENEKNWLELPSLEGLNIVGETDPKAASLLTNQRGDPILVIERIEAGKVATFLSDSSWKWVFMGAGEGHMSAYYERFWHRLLLWLVDDPELREIKITTDKPSYAAGEHPKIKVLRTGDRQIDDPIKLTITTPGGKEVGLDATTISNDTSNFMANVEENGIYKLKSLVEGGDGSARNDHIAETAFIVEPPDDELRGPTTDEDLLRLIAEGTGGKFVTLRESPESLAIDSTPIRKVNGYKTVELWNSYWAFLLLVSCLSSEWLLRRKWGLR